jgi:hypothetical protein
MAVGSEDRHVSEPVASSGENKAGEPGSRTARADDRSIDETTQTTLLSAKATAEDVR